MWTLLTAVETALYGKPYCSTNACTGTYDGCSTCLSPYVLNASLSGCHLDSTSQAVAFSQLPSESSFSVSGYLSNVALAVTSCINTPNTYHMLGPFVAENYIYQEFTGLGTGHF